MARIDKKRFQQGHYLGRPADATDRIVEKRISLTKAIPDFCNRDCTLVDVGCGNGASLFLLSATMKHATGIDVFPDNKTSFLDLRQKMHRENTSFELIDLEKTSPTQQFDRLISFEVIEHFEDEKMGVKNMFNILKKNGLGVISVPNKWWVFETHGAKLPLLPWNRVPFFSWLPQAIHERYANARIYTKTRIRRLLEEAGFEVVSMQYITAPMDVLPESEFKNMLLKYVFRGNTTNIPFLATSIFVQIRKNGNKEFQSPDEARELKNR